MRRPVFLCLACLALAGAASSGPPITGVTEMFPVEPGVNAERGFAVAVSGDWLAMGARLDDEAGEDAGAVYVFHWSGTAWEQTAKLHAAPPQQKAQFGLSLALRGGVLAVGAPGEGAVYIFQESEGGWVQHARLVSPAPALAGFGLAVAVGDGEVATGAGDGHGREAGAVVLFEAPFWTVEQVVQPVAPQAGERFGHAVSLAGDVLVAGAPGHDFVSAGPNADAGAAYVFERQDGAWRESKLLRAQDSGSPLSWNLAGDQFGFAVATDGSQIIVGSPTADATGERSGAVYRFVRNGANWVGGGLLEAGVGPGAQLGFSVAVAGGLVAAGSPAPPPAEEGRRAEVRVFKRSGGSYIALGELPSSDVPSNAEIRDLEGFSTAVDGDRVVTSAPLGDQGSGAAGAAWSFRCSTGEGCMEEGEAVARDPLSRDSETFDQFGLSIALTEIRDADDLPPAFLAAGTPPRDDGESPGKVYIYRRARQGWRQEARLVSSFSSDGFGTSVALAGPLLAVGAPQSSILPVSPPVNFLNGHVELFSRRGSSWVPERTFVNPNPDPEAFGTSVSLGDGVLVVGAPRDSGPGAVYVFEKGGQGWTQAAWLTAPDARPADGFGTTVSVSGNLLAIGAPGMDSGTGAVYVSSREPGGGWSEPLRLPRFADPLSQGQRLGTAVTIDGGTVAAGAPEFLGGQGAVYIFEESDGWRAAQSLVAGPNRRFGTSLALLGDRLVVGARGQGPIEGQDRDHAFLFERRNGVWVQVADLDAVQPPIGDQLGTAVALTRSFLAVSSPGAVRSPRVTLFDLVPP
jgi:hypothetical protein